MFDRIYKAFGMSYDQTAEEGETLPLSELKGKGGKQFVNPDASHLVGIAAGWVSSGVRRSIPAMADDFELPELIRLINRPNSIYGGADLLDVLAFECLVYGTSFARIVRGALGVPERLQYLPAACVKPTIDDQDGLTGYTYTNARQQELSIAPEDMLTFKWRIDPKNQYLGISPFARLKNLLYIDEESISVSSSILYNLVIGLFISAEAAIGPNGNRIMLPSDEIKSIRQKIETGLGNNNRGALVTSPVGLKIDQLGDTPDASNLIPGHNLVEERVCSAIKVHPSVLGLGTGVQNTRVGATAAEYRRESWVSGILPVISILETEINSRLVPEFTDSADARFILGVSHIPDLRPSVDDVLNLIDRGVVSAEAGAALLGYEYTGGDQDGSED